LNYLPSILAMMKMRTAPPRPPPKRRYRMEKPMAPKMGIKAMAIIR
jgi:hypothetical protein